MPEGFERDAVDAAVGRLLISQGKLDGASLERARRVADTAANDRLSAILVKLGLVAEADMAHALADALGLSLVSPFEYPDEPVAEDRLSSKFLKEVKAVPLTLADGTLTLAMADPLDEYLAKAVHLATGLAVERRVGIPADIERALDRIFGSAVGATDSVLTGTSDADEATEDAERLKDMASEAPVIKLVNALIWRAVEARASDIHIEPFEGDLRVRYRIDGVLKVMDAPSTELKSAIVSRIKIMSKLNIAERRLPQDGRIKLAVRGQEIDFRVSTLPTLHGESVVMRVLDKRSTVLDFEALGFAPDTLEVFLSILEQPNGILLVTGPTGSGKTTTLYTSLLRINSPDLKLITVEDPIEYQLHGINQIQVKPQIGLTFGHSLRSILRQDPDVIMIGEIRDRETAQIAAQAALTGHLVLSTLHTNSAAGSVTRLLDIGLEDYLLASTVNGVAAQRLVRVLCPECRERHPAVSDLAREFELHRYADDAPIDLFRPRGCDSCGGSGYVGRSVIAEMLVMTEELRRLALRRADARDLHKCAVASGMRTLYEDGIRKALAGVTSLEEVLRVTRDA